MANKVTVEKAVQLKKELEDQVKGLMDMYSRKTGIVLKTVKASLNTEALTEIQDGQLTFLDDMPIYLKVDIVGEI